MPATLFATTSGSALESGYFQWSAFITEWMMSPVFAAASLISSASSVSAIVPISMPSKPTSCAIWKRCRYPSSFGSIET